ncbi:MAG TPA: hypothetical protein VJV03_10555 [Pyrinomonadaceae bacterium]|nr:hypothetical protein [Pyrinomonadaceae bacterium]
MREHFVFLSLIAITLVLPVVAYCSHEGPISPVAFAVCATFGVGRGLVMYRRGSNAVNYLMGTGIVPRAPLSNVGLKKAA